MWNTKYAGKLAGFVNSVGLPMIQIGRTSYKQSRIAYAYVNGDIGNGDVDHINRDVKDNRICNLRYVTHSENGRNRRVFKNNKTGITGVGFHKNLRQWQSHIRINKNVKKLSDLVERNIRNLAKLAEMPFPDYSPVFYQHQSGI